MHLRTRHLSALLVLACATTAGCGQTSAAPDRSTLSVAVAFYPLEEIVRNVGGGQVRVVDLTPPGGEPHDLDLTPERASDLERADVVFYLGQGFQPAVEKAVAGLPGRVTKVDLLSRLELLPVTPALTGTNGRVNGEELAGGKDPHVWVDPENMVALTAAMAETLDRADPAHAAEHARGADAYRAKLAALSQEFATTLRTCASRSIVTSHRAFEYLARRYRLKQIPIAGISPDEEPDPRSLEAVTQAAKADGVRVIFFEHRVSPKLSETVAAEIGATTDTLDPVETLTREDLQTGTTYLSIQAANLAALARALRCS